MSDQSLDNEGMTPNTVGQHREVDEHSLIAEAGALPANDLVWRCEYCGVAYTGTGYYYRTDCGGGDS